MTNGEKPSAGKLALTCHVAPPSVLEMTAVEACCVAVAFS
jgi:hypothetical protein